MKLTCPACHCILSLETFLQDASARDLFALRGELTAELWPPLVGYLGLFRSPARALAWARALKIARETVALTDDHARLAVALGETVEAMRRKQEVGEFRPFKNHRYLTEVLAATPAGAVSRVGERLAGAGKATGRAQSSPLQIAADLLGGWAGEHWLRNQIRHGLLALLAQPLGKAPAVATISATADVWAHALSKAGCTIEAVDLERVGKAISDLVARPGDWFPTTEKLLGLLPRRPHREKLPDHVPDDLEKGRGFFKELGEKL